MRIQIIRDLSPERWQKIEEFAFLENGLLRLRPAKEWHNFLSPHELCAFGNKYARYGIPTTECIDFIKSIIGERLAIEIGAGHGDLGYHLGIVRTDSKLQDRENIKKLYSAMGQPIIKYPADVKRAEALKAIDYYKPQVVIASWVTALGDPTKVNYDCNVWGVDENELLLYPTVETYILVGNLDIHGTKPILNYPHEQIKLPGLISRAQSSDNNRIFIFKGIKEQKQ